jgi:hypothetical protein
MAKIIDNFFFELFAIIKYLKIINFSKRPKKFIKQHKKSKTVGIVHGHKKDTKQTKEKVESNR